MLSAEGPATARTLDLYTDVVPLTHLLTPLQIIIMFEGKKDAEESSSFNTTKSIIPNIKVIV